MENKVLSKWENFVRKCSPKYYFKKCIKNVIKRNLVKRSMVCLFSKLVRFLLEQVPYIIESQYQYNFSLDESIAE